MGAASRLRTDYGRQLNKNSSSFVHHAIAAVVFGLVEAIVGAFDHLFGIGGVDVFGVRGDSGADGDFDGAPFDAEVVALDVLAQALAEDGGAFA